MKNGCIFWLLAGALLQDTVNWDNDLLCSNANITDDLALYHLKTNPNCREQFETLPENVDDLIEAYKLPGTEEAEKIDSPEQLEAEANIVSQIGVLLKNKTSKTAIKKTFATVEKIGEKNLTQRFLGELIKLAEIETNIPGQDL